MLRTYEGWSAEWLKSGTPLHAQLLFVLAWFHAVVQERRSYIPQVGCMCVCVGGSGRAQAFSAGLFPCSALWCRATYSSPCGFMRVCLCMCALGGEGRGSAHH